MTIVPIGKMMIAEEKDAHRQSHLYCAIVRHLYRAQTHPRRLWIRLKFLRYAISIARKPKLGNSEVYFGTNL